MSSSYVVEPQDSGSEKKDDTLIIVVNDDGTISVDQETLQSLIMNQANANVSVVRVGQAETDAENGDITLTVDPPPFTPATVNSSGGTTDAGGLVDPFMEMDPEQLERLETALQSEEAKQILGENVTAMLDMLTVEEQQNSIRYSVELDHCYTSRLSPSDPKPRDPLPVTDSPITGDNVQYARQISPSRGVSGLSSSSGDYENTNVTKPKILAKTVKQVGRPRKSMPSTSIGMCGNSRSAINVTGTPKLSGHPIPRNVTSAIQHGMAKSQGRAHEEEEDELTSSSSESSESEPPSDNDSDFGPRGPRRGGSSVRARGGRKGLTTRGGSMAAARRRGTNKHMDMEQVRRLDMEMAAAVNAMKSPEKDDKSGGFSPVKGKRQFKTTVGRKKEESARVESSSIVNEDASAMVYEKPLQTTNQVKANLINANMIKGDMILTKPGQGKTSQKVTFVQKQVLMKPNELKSIGLKKQLVLPKGKFLTQGGTKFFATKDGKLLQVPMTTKTVTSNVPVAQIKTSLPQSSPAQQQQQQPPFIQNSTTPLPQQQQITKVTSPTTPSKAKLCEPKKEKRKSDGGLELPPKTEVDPAKTPEAKLLEGAKKHPKKEHRKSPAYVVDTLGPALFSTPDIIRRVGSNGESRTSESTVTSPNSATPSTSTACSAGPTSQPTTPPPSTRNAPNLLGVTASVTSSIATLSETAQCSLANSTTKGIVAAPTSTDQTAPLESRLTGDVRESDTSIVSGIEEEQKLSTKPNLPEELQPSLDSGSIEGEEHLLATLEMEASKHEEELLAEALLLQEELGVDLADHPALVEQGGGVAAETLTTAANMLIPTLITTEQAERKPADALTTHAPITVATISTPVTDIAAALSPSVTTVTPATLATMSTLTPVTSSTVTMTSVANVMRELAKKATKDDKEPIQIVRGGRVITLPPIEAPATRSKRLQAKVDLPQKIMEPVKRTDKFTIQTLPQKSHLTKAEVHFDINAEEEEEEEEEEDEEEEDQEDEEEEDDEEEDNSDSEDDPDRLWCICKRPHNNRFMICCDVCEDWFHGKCVHVSKAMGQQMEEKGIEWVCPNCAKKKSEEAKMKANLQAASGKQRIVQLEHTDEDPVTLKNLPSSRETASLADVEETSPSIPPPSDYGNVHYSGTMQCVVCKKEARNSSIYCSDACILAHAQETLTKDKPSPGPAVSPKTPRQMPYEMASKVKPEARVIVFERKTGRVLTGADAPTRSNLKTWLKENPTFEVVGANTLNTLQIGKPVTSAQSQVPGKTGKLSAMSSGKTQTVSKMVYTKVPGSKQMILTAGNRKYTVISSGQHQQQQQQNQGSNAKPVQLKQTLLTHPGKSPFILKTSTGKSVIQIQPKVQNVVLPKQQSNNKKQEIKQPVSQPKVPVKPSPAKKPEPEPIRLNIRKTLTELLSSRIKETEDLKLSDEEIGDLAFNIELEMYKYFKDTGAKYKAKYRSLVFNIKDTKNLTLFRKIADRSLTPDAVVRLSPDEMASQELAEWREKETKHQLEMIKKNELDLMAQAKSIVVKTHKGEQIIENDGGIDHVDPKTPVQDIVTALNSGDGITSTIDETEKEMERERANEEDRGKLKGDTKKMKNLDEKRRKDKEKDKDRDRERERERGREKESGGRSKGRHDRSTSRGRHRHGRDDREHSKTREKSRERKSTRNKESRREKEKERERERERTKDRDRSKIREKGNKEKTRQKEKDRERHRGGENGSRNRGGDSKETEKRDEERKRDTDKKEDQSGSAGSSSTEKPIEDRLWRHIEDEATTNTIDGNDSDVSDREPTSTVTIKTPDINEEIEKEREQEPTVEREPSKGGLQNVWRGFVNMVDVAKFFITAQEVSGQAKDLMEDLPDTVDVVGRISHETVWDYISKMKKTGSKEILVIRLTAANDEEKIPYITLYSYLNSRSRLGVVGNVSKNIKDFYIMPFSSQSKIPPVLLPLNGPGFEEHRPHLLLGIIVRNKRKRLAGVSSSAIPSKLSKKDADRSYTPPLLAVPKDKSITASSVAAAAATPTTTTTGSSSPALPAKSGSMLGLGSTDSTKDKHHSVTQITLESLNKAHIGMSRSSMLDTAAICKIVPELSSKLDLTSSPSKPPLLDDDGDEPYSPGGMDDDDEVNLDLHTSLTSSAAMSMSMSAGIDGSTGISSSKNSSELQRKMEELNRQIEEQKQQIQSISSSFLGESTSTLPGLGLDPPAGDECEEAYSPTDSRSFTPPPPPGISKFTQPILEKVSNITIPPNLQEILANVKRQESSKVDPYLPSKPSATFLTTVNSSIYQNSEKYTPMSLSKSNESRVSSVSSGSSRSTPDITSIELTQQTEQAIPKESKSTLSTLSDLDLIRKAEEELAAVAAASTVVPPAAKSPSISTAQPAISLPGLSSTSSSSKIVESSHPESPPPYKNTFADSFKRNFASEQPKPPGLEDEEFPPFPSTPPSMQGIGPNAMSPRSKFVPKSGIILSVKRKAGEESETSNPSTPTKTPRIKSRWGQGPSDSVD